MGCFICDKCGHIENTAMGTYWHKKDNELKLCTKCETGKWHDVFPYRKPTKEELKQRHFINRS